MQLYLFLQSDCIFSKEENEPSPLTTRAPTMSTNMTARAKQTLKEEISIFLQSFITELHHKFQ